MPYTAQAAVTKYRRGNTWKNRKLHVTFLEADGGFGSMVKALCWDVDVYLPALSSRGTDKRPCVCFLIRTVSLFMQSDCTLMT